MAFNGKAEKLNEELRRLSKLVEDKETELKNKNSARYVCMYVCMYARMHPYSL